MEPITPANVASLQKTGEIRYSPWELVMAIAWSQDGARLAVAAGETIHIYDGQTLEQVQALTVSAWANSLAFLPGETGEGWIALVTKDGSLQFWEIATAQRLCRIEAHLKGANSLALSPDGRFVGSTGNDGIVRLWETAPILQSGACPEQPFAEMIGGAFAVTDVEFNPVGDVVAAANANIIHLRDPATQRLIRTLYGEGSIFSIAYRPDGLWLAAAEMGGSARLWDGETGDVLAVLTRPEDRPPPEGGFLWSVAFNHAGSLLAGGASDGLLLLWDLSLQPAPPGLAYAGHARALTSLVFSPEGSRLATGSLDGSVLLWGIP
jgi:WD40 repeat protein